MSGKTFIPPHGHYLELRSYQKAHIVYLGTMYFCDRWIDSRSRTHDQMVQAARSGEANIREGSAASGISKETEIRLTGVARASLEEVIGDYLAFLENRGTTEWPEAHPYRERLVELNRLPDATYETFRKGIESEDPIIAANILLGLTRVTNYLLDQQLKRLQLDFLQDGGLRERMAQARLSVR